jgi:SAM-dependent MidA family methyltransferase
MQSVNLPQPTDIEKQHSAKLVELVAQRIEQAGGWISFAEYMQLALYAPGLGYYSAGLHKFGEAGDFITAPEIGSLFARTLARPVAELMDDIPAASLLEFGAGSGQLAADLLAELNSLGQLPERYLIVELSAELRQRQQQTLHQQVPELLHCVHWMDRLPDTAQNLIVIANEVLDAMPVTRFSIKDGKVFELGVRMYEGELKLQSCPADEALQQQVEALGIEVKPVVEYHSEINQAIAPWLASLADCIEQGVIYLIDYGYTRGEYYSAERHMGTFIGYYRHRALDAPLWYPGLQDLTAFVDFTAVAEAALEAGLDVDGFTSQGNFLLDCGLGDIVQGTEGISEREQLQLVQQMKTLSLPGEMGERFKVMGLSKGLQHNVPGFSLRDLRYSL